VNVDEYARMRDVEDRHWWYDGLHQLVWSTWSSLPHDETLPVLDIGCGTGGTIARAPGPAVGTDRSPEALRLCRERGQRKLALADAGRLPFQEESFAGAISLDVMCHRAVGDPADVLREARRVIASGGYVILNLPAYNWLQSSHDVAVHTVRRFTRSGVMRLFDAADLEPVRATYWNTLLFPAAAAVRLARRGSGRDASDLDGYEESIGTKVATGVLGLERAMLRRVSLPFGLSVFGVGRKP
jgi:SAM-dependent methyltransferase